MYEIKILYKISKGTSVFILAKQNYTIKYFINY
jgi:hypothetical protein